MSQQREARTPTTRGKRIDHLLIRTSGDTVTVEHHYKEDGLAFHAPKSYDFGKDETSDLVQHLGKYAGLPVSEQVEDGSE